MRREVGGSRGRGGGAQGWCGGRGGEGRGSSVTEHISSPTYSYREYWVFIGRDVNRNENSKGILGRAYQYPGYF